MKENIMSTMQYQKERHKEDKQNDFNIIISIRKWYISYNIYYNILEYLYIYYFNYLT